MILAGLGIFALFGVYSASCAWLRKSSRLVAGDNAAADIDMVMVYLAGAFSAAMLGITGIIGGLIGIGGVFVIAYGLYRSLENAVPTSLTKRVATAFDAMADIGDRFIGGATKAIGWVKGFFSKKIVIA